MATFNPYAGLPFGIRDAKIALYNSADETYGTLFDIPGVSEFTLNLETINSKLEGDDEIVGVYASGIGVNVTVKFGGIPLEVYEVLAGLTRTTTYGTTPNRKVILPFTASRYPYVGIVGKMLSAEDDGATVIFVPKIKVMDGFSIGSSYGQFVAPQVQMYAVSRPSDQLLLGVYLYETEPSLTVMPPSTS
jgi:hypothetical protein